MRNPVEAREQSVDPMEAAVYEVAEFLQAEGFLPQGARVIRYSYPPEGWKAPSGEIVPPIMTGFAILDERVVIGHEELGTVGYLAQVEKHYGHKSTLEGPTTVFKGYSVTFDIRVTTEAVDRLTAKS